MAAFALGLTSVEIVRPTASYKAIELGATAFDIGLVGGSFGFLAFFAALPIGRSVDTRGERRFVLLGLVGVILAITVQMLATNVAAMVLGQALVGLGQMALAIATQSLTAHSRTPFGTDERFARLAIAASIGLLGGPAISGMAIGDSVSGPERKDGIHLAYLFALVLAALALIVAWRAVQSSRDQGPDRTQPVRSDLGSIIRTPGVMGALVASASVLTTGDLLIAYLPLLGEERYLAPSFVGVLLSVRAGSEMLARFALPIVLRRASRSRILSLTFLTAAGAMATLTMPSGRWLLIASMIVIGFSLGVCAPMTAAWIVSSAPATDRGAALAIRMATNRLGQMIVPAAVGAVAVVSGSFVVFVVAAVGLVISSRWVTRYDRANTAAG